MTFVNLNMYLKRNEGIVFVIIIDFLNLLSLIDQNLLSFMYSPHLLNFISFHFNSMIAIIIIQGVIKKMRD